MVSIGAMLCVVLSISGAPAERCEPDFELGLAYIREMRNSDLKWDGDFLGVHPISTPALDEFFAVLDTRHLDALADAMWDEDRFAIAHVLLIHKVKCEFSCESSSSCWMGLSAGFDHSGIGIHVGDERFPLQQIWRDRIRQMKAVNPSTGAPRSARTDIPPVRLFPPLAWVGEGGNSEKIADGFLLLAGDCQSRAESWTTRNREAELQAKNRLKKLRDERTSGRRWLVEVETASAQQR